MSYILDALKKSEEERLGGSVPNLDTVQSALNKAPQSSKKSLYWLLALVGFLLFFSTLWLGYQFQKTITLTQQLPQAGSNNDWVSSANKDDAGRSQLTDVNNSVTMQTGAPIDLDEIRRARNAQANAQQLTASQDRVVSLPEPVFTQETLTPSANPVIEAYTPIPINTEYYSETSDSSDTEKDYSDLPYLNELAAYERNGVPALKFSSHMFSSSANHRTVVINGASLKQGDRFARGLKVEAITEEGVVIDKGDLQFRINVMQDWTFE